MNALKLYTHSNLKNKGITLIALVITIIILLILAGITIAQLTGNGLFGKSKIAKQKTRYEAAKEVVNLKLMEIQVDCEENNDKVYNIKEIAEGMKLAEDITIEKYYNKGTSKIKDDISENLKDLEAIVVSANEYSEYKFLIGEERQIVGVLEGEVTNTTSTEDFTDIEEFEARAFSSADTTATDSIQYSYEKERIASNKMQLLITIKDEENGLDKIEYPDGDVLNCNGKNEIPIDYTIEYGIEYVFKITSNNGYVKNVSICEYRDLELKTGDYVEYTANGYSKWITIGTDKLGVIKIVSVGAPEAIALEGGDLSNALKNLNDYCDQKYANKTFATSAECYCYSTNIYPLLGEKNVVVLNGLQEETGDDIKERADWWFWSAEHHAAGVMVRWLGVADYSISYVECGDSRRMLLRPVVTLRKDLKIKSGDGSKESPYVLVNR